MNLNGLKLILYKVIMIKQVDEPDEREKERNDGEKREKQKERQKERKNEKKTLILNSAKII